MTKHARNSGLARSILIRCARDNTASRKVAENAGYTRGGSNPRPSPWATASWPTSCSIPARNYWPLRADLASCEKICG